AWQVLAVPGVPAIGGRQAKPPPTDWVLHSLSAVQRQKPMSQPMPLGQSAGLAQRSPLNTGSVAGQTTLQFWLDGTSRLERKEPATSATIGYSFQVHELCGCENSTSPERPS